MSAVPTYQIDGSGPLLVYLAGLDGTGQLFFRQTPGLAKSYRVVTFRSRDRAPFDYDGLSDDVAAIIRNTGETRALLVGESFGGTVALNFALRYPSMVSRLVIVNSFPKYRGRIRLRLLTMLSDLVPSGVMVPMRMAANSLGLFIDSVRPESRRRFFEAMRSVSHEAYLQRLRLIASLDVEQRLQYITAPVLLIAADRDIVVPSVKEARMMSSRISNATVRVVKRAGHACLIGDRVELVEELSWWEQSTGSGREDVA
jgi:3-oxoadipate enol-lactonase